VVAKGGGHRARREVDYRAREGAAYRFRGARRRGLRVLGPAHRPGRHPARRHLAGGARADRADRQAARAAATGRIRLIVRRRRPSFLTRAGWVQTAPGVRILEEWIRSIGCAWQESGWPTPSSRWGSASRDGGSVWWFSPS